MSNYMEEFPDYDDTLSLPNSWIDISWQNDPCPSFEREHSEIVYRLFCDYVDSDKREMCHEPRFVLYIEDQVNFVCIGQFHTLAEALALVEKEIAA